MLVGVATLPSPFPPSGTLAFSFINRPPWAKILSPSACSASQFYGGDFAKFLAFSEYMNFTTRASMMQQSETLR